MDRKIYVSLTALFQRRCCIRLGSSQSIGFLKIVNNVCYFSMAMKIQLKSNNYYNVIAINARFADKEILKAHNR